MYILFSEQLNTLEYNIDLSNIILNYTIRFEPNYSKHRKDILNTHARVTFASFNDRFIKKYTNMNI
jgi:hypothetical protein